MNEEIFSCSAKVRIIEKKIQINYHLELIII